MLSVKEIIKKARGNKSQEAFAREIGKSQGTLSKYETGEVSPPSEVLEHCMHLLNNDESLSDTAADTLANRVLYELNAPEYDKIRQIISFLIDTAKTDTKHPA